MCNESVVHVVFKLNNLLPGWHGKILTLYPLPRPCPSPLAVIHMASNIIKRELHKAELIVQEELAATLSLASSALQSYGYLYPL